MAFSVRVLAGNGNARGDLFARLMKDLLLALGYDDKVRFNVHRAGREVDLETNHRVEPRRAVAECKAEATPIGGDAINKFVGALDAERRKWPDLTVIGYFISLSGFTETAVEQELECGGKRLVLLDAQRVVEQLAKGRIIAAPEKVLERAGRCLGSDLAHLVVEGDMELIAHPIGWIWAVYYGLGQQRTHFVLIHADGAPLAHSIAADVISMDQSCGGLLHKLTYVGHNGLGEVLSAQVRQAEQRYTEYILRECGHIELAGLPADQEVGSKQLRLENLFVPMKLVKMVDAEDSKIRTDSEPIPVGRILARTPRIALLAAPGGGKSTLLKRLAVAYASANRYRLVDDRLPRRKWLPVLIRCRDLGNAVGEPILDVVTAIAKKSGLEDVLTGLHALVDEKLRNGQVLLLIDGLDEIADERSRLKLVAQLRACLATYPHTALVITSREAGFRVVGGSLASYCTRYRLAEFDDEEIERLTVAWHREVVGNRPDVEEDATSLARSILSSDRVRQLATNPLLLTTLLLVKRWVGQLPTKRSILYGKAIEVLLMTWNVAGHDPLDPEEVIPQLSFVAFQMMQDGVQRISARRLRELLLAARKQMPELLSYSRISVSEFVERVELRSSLMVLSGHSVEDGTLTPMYEFRHLTFQEYLTAKAITEGYYPNRSEEDTILTTLGPHLSDESWREVVPLAAVLAGRRGQTLARHLIDVCKEGAMDLERFASDEEGGPEYLLARCILDEIQLAPDLLKEALEWIGRLNRLFPSEQQMLPALAQGKFRDELFDVVLDAYTRFDGHFSNLGSGLSTISLERLGYRRGESHLSTELLRSIQSLVAHEDYRKKCCGMLATMGVAYDLVNGERRAERTAFAFGLQELSALVANTLVRATEPCVIFAGTWASCWLIQTGVLSLDNSPETLAFLLRTWADTRFACIERQAGWALSVAPLVDRDAVVIPPEHRGGLVEIVSTRLAQDERDAFTVVAAYVVAYYLRQPWDDETLAQRCQKVTEGAEAHQLRGSETLQAIRNAIIG